MLTALQGFLVGLSLILAIGAQNAFVLKQGLKGEYVFWVCLICALSDAVLIAVGVAGFHTLVAQYPMVAKVALWGGVAFLIAYGLRSFWRAYQGGSALVDEATTASNFMQVVLICLAFTWLNPHVYLDTVVFMGSVSAQFPGRGLQFGLGAATASFVWFFGLGYGAAFLRPLFAKPVAWRLLDGIIGVVMWAIALSLMFA